MANKTYGNEDSRDHAIGHNRGTCWGMQLATLTLQRVKKGEITLAQAQDLFRKVEKTARDAAKDIDESELFLRKTY